MTAHACPPAPGSVHIDVHYECWRITGYNLVYSVDLESLSSMSQSNILEIQGVKGGCLKKIKRKKLLKVTKKKSSTCTRCRFSADAASGDPVLFPSCSSCQCVTAAAHQ